jgi:nucleoside-diphosphate-sugar epimerase
VAARRRAPHRLGMTALRVLFIGGTGIISSACARLAVERGIELHLLKRSRSSLRPVPEGVVVHEGDVRDPGSVRATLGDQDFDVVVDWVAFTPEHVQTDVDLFAGRTGQYVFISSASAYKIACEDLLVAAYRDTGFPMTIVRPSHTYDAAAVPFDGGWTVVDRMRRGAEVVVPGDGTSLWTITHNTDFARGFVGLLGRSEAIGEAFHITSDEALPWNRIYTAVAQAAGVEPRLVHVPSDAIAAADPDWGAGLLGDKAHSMVFDNTKVRRLVPDSAATVPFEQGAREIVEWHDAHPEHKTVDARMDALMDRLVETYRPRPL